ncbi:MAG: fibrobacter succinogenes major paralogous domain-containing protein [Dysgonamonadaceae bacterium]|jgi:uncharacterized protein (TIGR02145 family)|nr:fibrobacter succinogenes major paralogous domain-containing protein [Dysgonamonadaceae bacterium]
MSKTYLFRIWLFITLGFVAITFTSCDESYPYENPYNPNNPNNVTGVVINGVEWATCNVNTPGTFAAKPEDFGLFYQWNLKKAWPVSGDITGWNTIAPGGSTWEKDNDPSPAGWHVPTFDEISSLLDTENVTNEWVTQKGVTGSRFTDKATGNSIFLPAAGWRYHNVGTFIYAGMSGNYWSSSTFDFDDPDIVDAYYLGFSNFDGIDLGYGLGDLGYSCDVDFCERICGYCVRSVRDTKVDQTDTDTDAIVKVVNVEINGIKWATHNLNTTGTFTNKPEDFGMLYQWNRKKGWPATRDDIVGWDDSTPEGVTWETVNDPCPAGYRVPTHEEIKTLFEIEKVTAEAAILEGVTGIKFTDITTKNSIFFPAAGYRSGNTWFDSTYRINRNYNYHGAYWSSTEYEYDRISAYGFYFSFNYMGTALDYVNKDSDEFKKVARSIRPVAE